MLEAFRMIAHDRGWLRRLREAVTSGLTAEAAVERVQNDARAKLQRQTDPYLRDRLHDLTDIANRLLHQLAGQSLVLKPEELPDNAILVARSMSPAALLDYDRTRLRGLVLEEAGAASHIAIVARALGVPAVSDIPNISEIVEHGDALIVDGLTGEVHVLPPPEVEAAYAEKARLRARRQDQYRALARHARARRSTASPIGLHMNAGLLIDLPHLVETGAQSIGLFRTELQFMLASRFPRLDAQETLYRAVLDAAGDRAGDLPHARHRRRQAAALHEVVRGGEPGARLARGAHRPRQAGAVAHPDARDAARRRGPAAAADAADGLDRGGISSAGARCSTGSWRFSRESAATPPTSVALGAMLEVPSLLWQLEEIAAAADFLSVGSNDLMQYLFAADRDNKRVAEPLRHAVAGVLARACGASPRSASAGSRRSRCAARSAAARWRR